MNDSQKKLLIQTLAADRPAYVPNYEHFKPGDTVLYSGPFWDNRELELAMEALLQGSWLTVGEYTVRFQNKFAQACNVKHAHMVNSGSSANLVMIAAVKKRLGWKDGDEVIVSPVGFPTTIAPLLQNGLKPVFVDIEMDTLNFDTSKIRGAITDKTVAILVSPVLGNPPDMDWLVYLADFFKIKLLGDHCDSLGTRWNDALLSDKYYAWTTSFFPAHHITTGEGGMVCSNDADMMKSVMSLCSWGRDCYCIGKANALPCGTCKKRFSTWLREEGVDLVLDHKYIFTNVGYNLKPLDLQGAIGLAQLEKLPEIESKRRQHKEIISKVIAQLKGVHVASSLPASDPCWFGIPIVCDTNEIRLSLITQLEANKIQTRPYFAGNLLRHPAYKHLANAADFPNADLALSRVFFIGCPPHYNEAVLDYICQVLKDWRLCV